MCNLPKGGIAIQESDHKKRDAAHVQSVGRAIKLLETLAEYARDISLTELAKAVGWPPSTVHGLLSTLRDHHYVEQAPVSGHYRLGIRLFELGNIVARGWDIRELAAPHMQRLNSELGEMVQLATVDRDEVLYIDRLDSNRLMRIVSDIGARLPMHCTGLGKAMLAYLNESEVRKIAKKSGLPAMTPKTITALPDLLKELEKVRENGYAIDDCEIMEGLRCVAAPILNRNNKADYAISVSGFSVNMQGERLEKVIQKVTAAAKQISEDIGVRTSR